MPGRAFEGSFRESGLPQALRTDNDVPFAHSGLHGLTPLAVSWLRLGIQHQQIRPACPVKRVTNAGAIRFREPLLLLASALKQHRIGLEVCQAGVWPLYLGQVLLGTIDHETMQVYD